MNFNRNIKLCSLKAFPLRAQGGISPNMALGKMPTRPALLLRLEDTSGCFGWGEIWANFPPRANIHKAHILEDVIASEICGMTYVDPREVIEMLRKKLSVYFLHIGQAHVFEHILAGIDIALWDLSLRSADMSFSDFMGLKSNYGNTYATSINASDLEQYIPKHAEMGQRFFKLKIGFEEHGTAEIVKKGNKLIPKGASIMVDSNQSWCLMEATKKLRTLEKYHLIFAEEPLRADASDNEWATLVSSTNIPIAAGENIYGENNYLKMAELGLKYLQPDVAKWGGMSAILDLAKKLPGEVKLWPHFMGTAIGQYAAISISAAIGEQSYCEVDVNENSLRTDLCDHPMTIRNGAVQLPNAPGLVPEPTERAIQELSQKVMNQ